MKSPLEFFFSLGDKVTGGDAYRKASFDYYLLWIMFLAFLLIAGSNINTFLDTGRYSYIGWSIVMLAVAWFQYSSLKMSYEARKLMKQMRIPQKELDTIEDVDKMLEIVNNERD